MNTSESCPICHEEYVASDYPECAACGRRVCDDCKGESYQMCAHTLCSECDEGEECPACIESDAERDEVLDVIRRS